MNTLIKKQLDKITSVNLDYKDTDCTIFIPKTQKILNSALKLNGVYIIELFDSIIDPVAGSTLASNWNNGIIPKYKRYTVEVVKSMSNMIKVYGVAVDNPSYQFSGWLPNDSFTILQKFRFN